MQFGFQEKKSTEDAILNLTEYVSDALDNAKPCMAVFIDLAKAFDTVSHSLLLRKLDDVGIRGRALSLMESYLSNRAHLTIAEKKKLIEKVEEGEKKSDVAKEFKIPLSTLSTIIKHKEKINAAQTAGVRKRTTKGEFPRLEESLVAGVRKRTTKGEFPRLEESLVIWLRQCRGQKVFISGNLLKEKAKEFASTLSILLAETC
ncbi:Reverse transcriptase (RNA-dependent DNA polymerase) [Popillia japonica]|uniref:Reverse transcriptase (RNA-dependent DNA polymerase) n=1 Tax=Popillia japonica TaxID=7064 RepID=A0AAW1IE11_POPJA